MDDLRGANALLTGAAGGLGGHIAETLVGCARSLRAELEGTPVSASVICLPDDYVCDRHVQLAA